VRGNSYPYLAGEHILKHAFNIILEETFGVYVWRNLAETFGVYVWRNLAETFGVYVWRNLAETFGVNWVGRCNKGGGPTHNS
jgi:sarcosine oxidase gamma subunit